MHAPLLPRRNLAPECYKAPVRLHLLSVREEEEKDDEEEEVEEEGHARRSWHQPVTPPLLLPPSVSLLNQITPQPPPPPAPTPPTMRTQNPSLNQFSLPLLPAPCPFFSTSPTL